VNALAAVYVFQDAYDTQRSQMTGKQLYKNFKGIHIVT
jgi:hypothetical protein